MRNTTTIKQGLTLINYYRIDPKYASQFDRRISTMGKEYLIPIFSIADLLEAISKIIIDDKYQFQIKHESFIENGKIKWIWIVGFRNKVNPIEVYMNLSCNPELIDALYDLTIKLIQKDLINKIPCKKYYSEELIPGQKFIVDDPYSPILGETLEFVRYNYSINNKILVCKSCRDNTIHRINIETLTMI